MSILEYEEDRYGGVVIAPPKAGTRPGEFSSALEATLAKLRTDRRRLAWLNLPTDRAELVPVAVRSGFVYHHADFGGVELVNVLEAGAHIPSYATHYIGAGGVVLDDQNRLLVVQERFRRRGRHWKLPGGALHAGEHIAEAVMREVLEETGIRTVFRSLTGFRHWHGYRYGMSDIYFICRLDPLNHEIVPDPEEIEEAMWMPLDDFLSDADTHEFNRRIVSNALGDQGMGIENIEGYGTPETHEMMFSRSFPGTE
jgi:8-oxo-dGTP pyrophosphatase MutT (NUDIX family)